MAATGAFTPIDESVHYSSVLHVTKGPYCTLTGGWMCSELPLLDLILPFI